MSVNNVKKEPEEKIKAKEEEAKEEVIKIKEEKEEEKKEVIKEVSKKGLDNAENRMQTEED